MFKFLERLFFGPARTQPTKTEIDQREAEERLKRLQQSRHTASLYNEASHRPAPPPPPPRVEPSRFASRVDSVDDTPYSPPVYHSPAPSQCSGSHRSESYSSPSNDSPSYDSSPSPSCD
jgi:hypothetical protein